MRRVFLIRCVNRTKGKLIRVGGFFIDDDEWQILSKNEVLRLINGGAYFFTTGADGSFAQVHTVHRRNELFLHTDPDRSLLDNLEHLISCRNFEEHFEDLVTLGRFRAWFSDRERT